MSKSLTILVTPMEGVGHVNACVGIAQCLKSRGHRIVFVVEKSYESRLLSYGFEEEILDNEKTKDNKPGEEVAVLLKESGIFNGMTSLEKMESIVKKNKFIQMIEKRKQMDPQFRAIVDKYDPDIIIIDDMIGLPSLIYANRPWVSIISTNPLQKIDDERLPPGGSGIY